MKTIYGVGIPKEDEITDVFTSKYHAEHLLDTYKWLKPGKKMKVIEVPVQDWFYLLLERFEELQDSHKDLQSKVNELEEQLRSG